MSKIIIKANNEKGRKAILLHLESAKKMSIKDRLIFRAAGYTQEVIDESTIELHITNRHSGNTAFLDLLKGEIKEALFENGAKEKDITLEVQHG